MFPEKRRDIQKRIVSQLATGALTHDEIAKKINYSRSGALSEYLDELISSGFVSQHFPWEIKSQEESKKNSRYRIRDSYLKFYLKYIHQKINQINKEKYQHVDITSLPGWDTIMGLQCENLVINNFKMLYKALNINPAEIVMDGPFLQNKTTKQEGCQIDYLLQTKYKTIYVCEIKFSRKPIGVSAINSVKEKIKRLKLPLGFSCIPVLIHASEVSREVLDQEYFARVINICDWL